MERNNELSDTSTHDIVFKKTNGFVNQNRAAVNPPRLLDVLTMMK